ncbi:MAG: Na+/H+ antiporter NhaA [Microscillaceae bacterium]|nr:Na+/H+ antiporter NhaA [Microscillaceae bacterium]MDW8460847.1 Na+/H+ antiporter NhaA [Cytophagales bacterium]
MATTELKTNKKQNLVHTSQYIAIQVLKNSGLLLLIAAIISLILNNTPLHHDIEHFWESQITLGFGEKYKVTFTVHYFVNEMLMTLFFVLVGLEIKRELVEGELSSFRKALLPVVAALGGMVVPALFYATFNYGGIYSKGWGIPMATDIAFALTIISILEDKVPSSLKIFLTALAIVDDLGAIIVIALFYSNSVQMTALLESLSVWMGIVLMGWYGVRALWLYAVMGFIMWILFLPSGIHPTIAGVLFAFAIPMSTKEQTEHFEEKVRELNNLVQKLLTWDKNKNKKDKSIKNQMLERVQAVSTYIESPLQNMINQLHGVSGFVVMPLFAFANAGIYLGNFSFTSLFTPLSLGIITGLLIGKAIGIFGVSWLFVKIKIADFPTNTTAMQFLGMAFLAGIGFTMSIFMSDLSFKDAVTNDIAKAAIFVASTLSGIVGLSILKITCKTEQKLDNEDVEIISTTEEIQEVYVK